MRRRFTAVVLGVLTLMHSACADDNHVGAPEPEVTVGPIEVVVTTAGPLIATTLPATTTTAAATTTAVSTTSPSTTTTTTEAPTTTERPVLPLEQAVNDCAGAAGDIDRELAWMGLNLANISAAQAATWAARHGQPPLEHAPVTRSDFDRLWAEAFHLDGGSITIDGAHEQWGTDAPDDMWADDETPQGKLYAGVWECLTDELELPANVVNQIEVTRALDGEQTASWDGLSAFWTYHPNTGLRITIGTDGA